MYALLHKWKMRIYTIHNRTESEYKMFCFACEIVKCNFKGYICQYARKAIDKRVEKVFLLTVENFQRNSNWYLASILHVYNDWVQANIYNKVCNTYIYTYFISFNTNFKLFRLFFFFYFQFRILRWDYIEYIFLHKYISIYIIGQRALLFWPTTFQAKTI